MIVTPAFLRQWCCEPLKNVKAIARVAEIVGLPPRLPSFRIISYESIGSTKKISAKECIFGEKHNFLPLLIHFREENHFAKKPLAERGGTTPSPLNGKSTKLFWEIFS